MSVTQPEFLFL